LEFEVSTRSASKNQTDPTCFTALLFKATAKHQDLCVIKAVTAVELSLKAKQQQRRGRLGMAQHSVLLLFIAGDQSH